MSNNNHSDFLDKDNIATLWEVIVDDETPTMSNVNNLRIHFINAVQQFNEIGYHPDLFQMNKKFLTLFLSNSKSKTNVPITAEEIQQDKKTQFESKNMATINVSRQHSRPLCIA